MATAAEAARHVFMLPQYFNSYLVKGIIKKKPKGEYDLDEVREQVITFLRGARKAGGYHAVGAEHGHEGMEDQPQPLNLMAEKARKEKESADRLAMLNAKERGELVQASQVEAGVTLIIGRCRSRLLAIPAKLAPLVSGETSLPALQAIITRQINEALEELSLASFLGASSGPEEGDAEMGPAPGDDRQSMG